MFMRHILVPIDFSPRSRPALEYAFRLAELTGAAVDVIHVVAPPSEVRVAVDAYLGRPLPQASTVSLVDARDRLQETVDQCERRGIVPSLRVEVGEPAATIVRLACETPADVVLIATRGHRGVAEVLLGSVAHRVITTASCPVLTFGEQASRSSAR
jgi:nucleotide-binding universal stress UspA family protein